MLRVVREFPEPVVRAALDQRANGVLARLDAADFQKLEPLMDVVRLEQNDVLHKAGQPAQYVYFPTSGVIRCTLRLGDGRSASTALIGSEGAAGVMAALSEGPVSGEDAVLVAGSALRVRAADLRDLFQDSPSACAVLMAHLRENAELIERSLACAACHRIEQRLANLYLRVSHLSRTESLPITQELAAAMLGAQRTTVTALAHGLKSRKAIAYLRARVVISDRKRLEEAACRCHLPALRPARESFTA